MPCELKMNKEDDIIEVFLLGDVTFDEVTDIRMQIASLCREKGYRRVLVDTTKSTVVLGGSTMDIFNFGTEVLSNANMPPDAKTAVVIIPNTKAGADWHFLATVEVNRGFNLAEFEDRDQARTWLLNK